MSSPELLSTIMNFCFNPELLESTKFNYTLKILTSDGDLVYRTNKMQTSSYTSYEGGLMLLNMSDRSVENNYLEITLGINSSKNFTTNVTVVLAYNSSTISATEEKAISIGPKSYTIIFNNETLKNTHYSSNFTIDSIVIGNKLFDTNRNTSVYNYEDFAGSSYIKSGIGAKIDSNNNDYYDYLEINFSIESKLSTTFTLNYDLYDEYGNFVVNISRNQALGSGTQVFQTLINGSDIYKSKVNGPYIVSFASLSTAGQTQDVLVNTKVTNETSYTEFERPPLPDLSINITSSFNQSSNVSRLIVTLLNNGTAPAFNVFLDVFDNSTYQDNRSSPYLEVGESKVYAFNITNSQEESLITAIVDFENLLDEKNESNNIAQVLQTRQIIVSLFINSLTEIYSENALKIFEFVINNNGTTNVFNVSWKFDTGDGQFINSTQNFSSLAASEPAFVFIAYNYSSLGEHTVNASAIGVGVPLYTLSAQTTVGDLSVLDFNVSTVGKSAVFVGTLYNNGNSPLANVNWSLSTGESELSSNSLLSLGVEESVFVIAGYDYPSNNYYTATLTAIAGSPINDRSVSVDLRGIIIDSFSTLNLSGTAAVLELIIENPLSLNLTGVNWSIDTKNNNILNSTQTLALEPNEQILSYIAYNFTSTGTFNVNATASNGTLMDSYNLNIII